MKNLTLVLNADEMPLNVASVTRAFNLVFKGKAVVVSHDEENPFVCSTESYKRPTIIKLVSYIYVPFKKSMPLTRHNIYRRDNHMCLYCTSKKNLTLDHVMPKSRGGKNTWENLATCCAKCNSKKDNKTPKEAGMTLLHKPYMPNYAFFVTSANTAHEHWLKFFTERGQL